MTQPSIDDDLRPSASEIDSLDRFPSPSAPTSWKPLPAHALADLFPMLEQADIERLADDICTFGQREPIVVLDGKVLDGRNRQAACLFADIEPIYKAYDGDDPLNFVLSLNLHRRHLTESQRAMVAAKIVDWERGLNQATAGSANLPTREAARRLSISERAVIAAKRIRAHGSAELVQAIEEGRVTVNAGEALSWLEQQEQARVLADEEKAIVARAKEIRARRQKLNHEGRVRHMSLVAEAGRLAAGTVTKVYPVIYADPPWRFGVRSEITGREKSAENHYPTMDTEAICGVLAEAGGVAARDAVLFLWATNPMLPDALRVMAAWGFTYVHHWIWDKEIAGTGYWGRDRHELLLIGRRGSPATPLPGSQPETVYRERKGRHSAKPDWFAEQIERLYPGVPRIELFCRSPRPGWDHWGYEAGSGEGDGDRSSEPNSGEEGLSATPREGATEATSPQAAMTADAARYAATQASEVRSFDDELYERAAALARETPGGPSAALFQERLGIGWVKAVGLMDRIEPWQEEPDTQPDDETERLYKRAVDHVRETRKTSAGMLQMRMGVSFDTATAFLDRMTAEKILPLEKIGADGRRKSLAPAGAGGEA